MPSTPTIPPHILNRFPFIRSITCPRCTASDGDPCVTQSGDKRGTPMPWHHIQRAALAYPDHIPRLPIGDDPESLLPENPDWCRGCPARSCDPCVVSTLKGMLPVLGA